jgi:hypothetical protein
VLLSQPGCAVKQRAPLLNAGPYAVAPHSHGQVMCRPQERAMLPTSVRRTPQLVTVRAVSPWANHPAALVEHTNSPPWTCHQARTSVRLPMA